MNTLSKEYALLFNTITDAEETLRQLGETLKNAQRMAEELFMSGALELPVYSEKRCAHP